MKAIVYTRYGSAAVLGLTEVPRPEPREDQVLVKVHAASANALDYRSIEEVSPETYPGSKARRSGNKVLGADISGQVEAIGASVKQFRPGDQVFGVSAGLAGGFAEYACAAEDHLALKPANLSFEAAAAIPVASLTALQGLRDKGRIQPGQKVLINGASGGVGTFAVQIAKSFGAEVTAVCSARNLDTARSIGADHVIDYRREDFTQNGKRYDLILGVNGYHPILDYRRALSPGGRYVAIGGSMPQILQGILMGPVLSVGGSRKLSFMGIARTNQKDLIFVRDLVEAGSVAPVIDRIYPLREAAAAFRYLAGEHAAGKVVFAVDQEQMADSSHLGRPS
jgi:NADPH:quinone reductase-like Zn-dependent oxidoreductase